MLFVCSYVRNLRPGAVSARLRCVFDIDAFTQTVVRMGGVTTRAFAISLFQ